MDIPVAVSLSRPPNTMKELVMKINVGSIDRAVRVVLGLVLIALFFILDGDLRYIGLIGIIPLATAAMRSCPLYSVLGMSTCPAENRAK